MLRLTIVGAQGRMGRAIAKLIEDEFSSRIALVGAIGRQNVTDFTKTIEKTDVIIDVSLPEGTLGFLAQLNQSNRALPYVIGCTGWKSADLATVRKYAQKTCVVLSPNFSFGITLFLGLVEQAAPILERWGYAASIHEIHHTKKLDAPSGTAKAIAERLAKISPQIHSTRAGNIVGTHELRLYGPGETLTFSHEALDRSIFARGAILTAEWAARATVSGRKPGLFSMKEVIFG